MDIVPSYRQVMIFSEENERMIVVAEVVYDCDYGCSSFSS